MEDLPPSHLSGAVTGEYFVSDDGSVRVAALVMNMDRYRRARSDLEDYKWNDADFLLAAFPKNGTNVMWEIMTMLLRGSADYIGHSKSLLMVDAFPVSLSSKPIPSPRVLNTHYRTDVLPAEFRKAKTVVVMRNPKDTCVSFYYHFKNILQDTTPPDDELRLFEKLTFAHFMELFLHDKDLPYGQYFDYIPYMWSQRDDPNLLVVFYEDLKMNALAAIQKVNEFMGTNRSPEVMEQIADAVNFDKMKIGKTTAPHSNETMEMIRSMVQQGNPEEIYERFRKATARIYRKGEMFMIQLTITKDLQIV